MKVRLTISPLSVYKAKQVISYGQLYDIFGDQFTIWSNI